MQIVHSCSNLNYFIVDKRQKIDNAGHEHKESPGKDLVPNTIDSILNMEADLPRKEEDAGGKTVDIGELEVDLHALAIMCRI